MKNSILIYVLLTFLVASCSVSNSGSGHNYRECECECIEDNSSPVSERISCGIIPSNEQLSEVKPYDRVVIIGVDGAGDSFEKAECPNFKNIFSKGCINYHGLSQYPTISAQNWCSMMYGVTAQTHYKTNYTIEFFKHDNESMPSVIKTRSMMHHGESYYSVVSWKPINFGLFEDFEELTKVNTIDLYPDLTAYETDVKTCDLLIERIKTVDDKIVFVHFLSVDDAGHAFGGASKEYFDTITSIDRMIGKIYDTFVEYDKAESTLFICVSDHGHKPEGDHGGETAEEKAAMLAVCGNGDNVIAGCCGKYVTHDLASIILFALGDAQPSHYEGGVPKKLFKNLC